MKYEAENGTLILDIQETGLEEQLRLLNGTSNSYASLENSQGDYIQVGGGPNQFTVESRVYMEPNQFVHKKARSKLSQSASIRKIRIGGSAVKVRQDQILDEHQVVVLFSLFLKGANFPDCVGWDDITDWF